jgi:hypothetical protein
VSAPQKIKEGLLWLQLLKRSGSWQAKIKRKGYPVIITFADNLNDDMRARKIECQIDSDLWVDRCV